MVGKIQCSRKEEAFDGLKAGTAAFSLQELAWWFMTEYAYGLCKRHITIFLLRLPVIRPSTKL